MRAHTQKDGGASREGGLQSVRGRPKQIRDAESVAGLIPGS